MGYEVRIDHRSVGEFPTQEAALARGRQELKARPDCEPEVIDTTTGKPFAPVPSRGWREQLAKKVGY
jgi:hypothetical protein